MNEIDLIIKWLQKVSGKLSEAIYYHETGELIGDNVIFMGLENGYIEQKNFYFGNLNLHLTFGGVPVLTDANTINIATETWLRAVNMGGRNDWSMGINHGLNLLGDGSYVGDKKIYQAGFNRLIFLANDMGVATWNMKWTFNGFVFVML
jgi:hypothetical protein